MWGYATAGGRRRKEGCTLMHNLEVSTMAMNKAREIAFSRRNLEKARLLAELGKSSVRPERSSHGGVLQLAWRVVDGARQRRLMVSGLHRGEREPHVVTTDELVMEIPGGR